MCQDLNPVKTLLGTQTHSFPTEMTHLVSGTNEAQVLGVSWQRELSETRMVGRGCERAPVADPCVAGATTLL